MIPAAFGVVQAALEALDQAADETTLANLSAEDIAAAWRVSSDICRTADAVYARLRAALTNGIIRASHSGEKTT